MSGELRALQRLGLAAVGRRHHRLARPLDKRLGCGQRAAGEGEEFGWVDHGSEG